MGNNIPCGGCNNEHQKGKKIIYKEIHDEVCLPKDISELQEKRNMNGSNKSQQRVNGSHLKLSINSLDYLLGEEGRAESNKNK